MIDAASAVGPTAPDGGTAAGDATAERIGRDLARLTRIVAHLRQHTELMPSPVVGLLVDRGPQRVGEIAAALLTDPSTVSRKVAALVDAGLVERRVDPADGRAHLLAVTAAGEHHWTAGRRHRTELVASVLAGWPSDAREDLAELLGRFADGLAARDRWSTRRSGEES